MDILTGMWSEAQNARSVEALEALEVEVIDRLGFARAASFRTALISLINFIRGRMDEMEAGSE